ncbi:MAG: hypothetical protein L0332_24540 [Chloroflexi bacterium]|nr:hypothetical protein [Chloroflexota bacterium]MCI0579874.1 hypothetical protein [Chloroflexota bacterium]MCI0646155.1 hypothetical protein [Chloroflexota bacterium]MCI0729865.1 hypothetical protein [Chloroflexota bacterium]
MVDKKERKTGLGIDAFFPATSQEEKAPEVKAPQPARTAPSTPRLRKAAAPPARKEPAPESGPPRRTAWLREDHLDRLELLKRKERRRLRQQYKRVSMTSLIDEAIEAYLQKMGV